VLWQRPIPSFQECGCDSRLATPYLQERIRRISLTGAALHDQRAIAAQGARYREADRVDIRANLFARHNGLMRTRELLAIGENDELIRIARNYGRILHVRQGWWTLPGTPNVLVRAWRAGGRLGCVSALAFHGVTPDLGDPIHIEVAAASKGARTPGVVVHWSSDQSDGDRRAVSVEVAVRQANRCRVAAGNLAAVTL
jgi:hypothetical protein